MSVLSERHRLVQLAIDVGEPFWIISVRVASFPSGGRRQIPERPQTRSRVGVLGARRARRLRGKGGEPRFERAPLDRRIGTIDHIATFTGISGEIVQLGDRDADVFLTADDHTRERRAAVVEHRRHRLEIRWAIRGCPTVRIRPQRVAGQIRGYWNREHVENRRQNVDMPRRHVRNEPTGPTRPTCPIRPT